MDYHTADEVSEIIEDGVKLISVDYRTRGWEITTANSHALDQIWLRFSDGRRRNLLKPELLKLLEKYNRGLRVFTTAGVDEI